MQTYIQQQQNQTPGPIGGQFGVNIEQQAIKTSNMPSISTQNFQQPASELESLVEEIKNEPPRFIKKTIHRKYTLGKSKINKNVGVLIKDKKTRKNILDAHKELKKKQITDIKKYLRDHGLIKIGSNAPNDVVRKIYESSMLSGDIINTSEDTLIHNFMNNSDV